MEQPHVTVKKMVDLINKLPEPAKPVDISKSFSRIPCACGHKTLNIFECERIDTGVVQVFNNVCPPCKDMYKGLATLVCVRSREVVARLAPVKAKNGFELKADHFYHLMESPQTNLKMFKKIGEDQYMAKGVILEKEIYNMNNK